MRRANKGLERAQRTIATTPAPNTSLNKLKTVDMSPRLRVLC